VTGPGVFFYQAPIAQLAKGGGAGLLGGFAPFKAVLDGHAQVRLELFVDLRVSRAAPEQGFPRHD
jgi:hypothetical protein